MSKRSGDKSETATRGYASPVCYAEEFPEYCGVDASGASVHPELIERLNALLEAERAGAKVLTILGDGLEPGSPIAILLKRVQKDEGGNATVLFQTIRRLAGEASHATGDFVEKTLAIEGLTARLKFVNKGQAWVARKIDEALPLAPDDETRAMLQEMKRSHLDNIAACAALIESSST